MFTLKSFQEQYNLDTTPLTIRERSFQFFVPRDLDAFVNHDDIFHDFPLWAKIWEGSLVLADYLAGLEPVPDKRFLEIGCGLGLVGIAASAFGHRVVMTEYDEHALNFARANAQRNNLPEIEITKLDWFHPQLKESFDCIIGSEIAYREEDFRPLSNLFKNYLKPSGEIILAGGIRETSMNFMKHLSSDYSITAKKMVLRSKEKEIPIMFSRMTMK
jgi:predicted nicotinamide N-methyase